MTELHPTCLSSLVQPAPAAAVTMPNVNLSAHALVIQKASLEGLVSLLQQYGRAYSELARFNSKAALALFEQIPKNHRCSAWTLGLMGKAHFELHDHKSAKQ